MGACALELLISLKDQEKFARGTEVLEKFVVKVRMLY